MEINATELSVELVEHTVIADAQFEFRPVSEVLVREHREAHAHLIHFFLRHGANGECQVVERASECG